MTVVHSRRCQTYSLTHSLTPTHLSINLDHRFYPSLCCVARANIQPDVLVVVVAVASRSRNSSAYGHHQLGAQQTAVQR
jgi:adenylate kinase